MIRYALPFTLMLASSAFAQDRMLRSDCQASVQRITDMIPMSNPSDEQAVARVIDGISVTPQGWCEIEARDLPDEAGFDTFRWRADGVKRWTRDGIPPLALELQILGLDPDEAQGGGRTNRPHIDLEVTLRQEPDAGQLILERAFAQNGAGDEMSFSGVFDRVFLSSTSMMQISLGSATFKAGLMQMTLEGTYENPFGFQADFNVNGLPRGQRDAGSDRLAMLPDGLMDDASRADLAAYVADLPKPAGTLEISAVSERGLGIIQVGASLYQTISSGLNDDEPSNELDILLDGVTVDASWTPSAQAAD